MAPTNPLIQRFGRLRYERELRGLTQDDAQSQTGIDRGTLSRIERGRRPPTDEQVEKLAALFGVSASTIRAWVTVLPASSAPASSPAEVRQ